MLRILIFLMFTCVGHSQILPSQQAVHYKKSAPANLDAWDPSEKSAQIDLSNGNLTATQGSGTNPYWNTVYGTKAVSSGTVEWEITINAWTSHGGNSYDVMIGISHSRTDENTHMTNSSHGYAYILENGYKIDDFTGTSYGDSYGVGDVIKISLNMTTRELTFYKNGVSQGVAYTVEAAQTYYLAAAFVYSTGTSITITG